MFKLALNAGHGIYTSGKRCLKSLDSNETREWELNDRICDLIEAKMRAYDGYELLRIDDTTGEQDIALKTRTDKANNWGADFYLAIHHNAGVKGGAGGGVIAITYKNVDADTLDWQKKLYDAIIAKTGLKGNRANPLQKQDLHEVRETKMAAVLLECGFMDSSTDVPIILTDTYADQVATACVETIVAKAGLSKKAVETPVSAPATTVTNTATATKSIEEIAREVIAGKWGNGVDRANRIKAAGYDYNAVQSKVNELCGATKTTTTVSTPTVNYYPRYFGTSGSIVTALNSLNIGSSFANRKKIAKANGITMYVGTASQNVKLLNLLKQGKLVKP